jgi:hypothetical protein
MDRSGVKKAMHTLLSTNGPVTDRDEAFNVLTDQSSVIKGGCKSLAVTTSLESEPATLTDTC